MSEEKNETNKSDLEKLSNVTDEQSNPIKLVMSVNGKKVTVDAKPV